MPCIRQCNKVQTISVVHRELLRAAWDNYITRAVFWTRGRQSHAQVTCLWIIVHIRLCEGVQWWIRRSFLLLWLITQTQHTNSVWDASAFWSFAQVKVENLSKEFDQRLGGSITMQIAFLLLCLCWSKLGIYTILWGFGGSIRCYFLAPHSTPEQSAAQEGAEIDSRAHQFRKVRFWNSHSCLIAPPGHTKGK